MSARAIWWLLVGISVVAIGCSCLWSFTILAWNDSCRDTGGTAHRVSLVRVECRYEPLE